MRGSSFEVEPPSPRPLSPRERGFRLPRAENARTRVLPWEHSRESAARLPAYNKAISIKKDRSMKRTLLLLLLCLHPVLIGCTSVPLGRATRRVGAGAGVERQTWPNPRIPQTTKWPRTGG